MKAILLGLGLLALILLAPASSMAPMCVGAVHAMQQGPLPDPPAESTLPDDQWCQRQADRMSRKAHACACHQHDCTKDPDDQQNRSAHTDPHCAAYCKVNLCRCERMDCP